MEDLERQARSLPVADREQYLRSIPEIELHEHLKVLFGRMETDFIVEITHGAEEFGKDLVLVRADEFEVRVTGVVVKKGDIKGTTSGKVTEILDDLEVISTKGTSRLERDIAVQMKEASDIPAELKSVFPRLKVNDVYVVIAGDIGNSARQRLINQLRNQAVQVYDLAWLVEKFTKFYPEVFFNGRAQDFVQHEVRRLETTPFMPRKGMNLTDYYVEPTFISCNYTLDLDPEHIAELAELPQLPFERLPEILAQKERVLILGDPGSGKSAALAKLALDMLHGASTQLHGSSGRNVGIPILMTARELMKVDVADDLIAQRLEDPSLAPAGLDVGCLLIDGIDELPKTERLAALQRAADVAKANKCPVMVTSRRVGDMQGLSNGTYAKYDILPFNPAEAMVLFKHLVSGEELEALKDGLQRIDMRIPLFPLSLMLLVQLVECHKEVPASITELYTMFIEIALGKYDRDRGIAVLFDYAVKARVLARLAYSEFFQKGRLVISHADFDAFVTKYAVEYTLNRETLEVLLAELERAGILDLGDEVEFRHRTFLDYFVAWYMFEKREEFPDINDQMVELYYGAFWCDVAFFYVGLKKEVTDTLLERLLRHEAKGLAGWIDKMMIGRLLQAGWSSLAGVKSDGLRAAIDATDPLRQCLLDIPKSRNRVVPDIYADLVLLFLVETSFSSMFLGPQLAEAFTREVAKDPKDGLSKAILILWAEQRLLTLDEIHAAVKQCMQRLQGEQSLSANDEARSLQLLKVIGRQDEEMTLLIKRKQRRLKAKYPQVFDRLLPPPRSHRAPRS